VACLGIHLWQYAKCTEILLHPVQLLEQLQFHSICPVNACGHLPTSPSAKSTVFTLFQIWLDGSLAMVPSDLSTLAHQVSLFWRWWIRILRIAGNSTLSVSIRWLVRQFKLTLWMSIASYERRWTFSDSVILRQILILNWSLPASFGLTNICLEQSHRRYNSGYSCTTLYRCTQCWSHSVTRRALWQRLSTSLCDSVVSRAPALYVLLCLHHW
jgi:hypothetical protein